MDKEKIAIERIKMAAELSIAHYGKPLLVTTSGGKDSDICIELALRSGVPFEVQHSLTTADAPQTVQHVKAKFRGLELKGIKCTINYPTYKGRRISMWSLIPQKLMPPTRRIRYCCEVLKEQAGKNRVITTGVRRAESAKRSGRGIMEDTAKDISKRLIINNDNDDSRQMIERCQVQAKIICNPIIDWLDREVCDYIRSEGLGVNPLYNCGFTRVG